MDRDGGRPRISLFASGGRCRCVVFSLAAIGLSLCGVSRAQDFVFTVEETPDPILVGNNISYSLSVSNATGFNLNPGILTSEYDTNLVEFVQATNEFAITNLPGLVIFDIPANAFPANGVIDVFLELKSTNVGTLTNIFRIAIDDQGQTSPEMTNVVSLLKLPDADLGVSVLGPRQGVFPGDRFDYRLQATNAGPDPVNDVLVSNLVPDNVSFISLSPSNSVTVSNGFVLFSVGTLTNTASSVATISVLATNAAETNLILATITAPIVNDTNTANNTSVVNVPILVPDTNQLVVTAVSAQGLNLQTGWVEQRVRVENVSTSAVESVRVLVDGLTNELTALVNAGGTNGSTAFVAHGAALNPGDQVDLMLEYLSLSRDTAGPDPSWLAYGTPPLDLTPRSGSGVFVDRLLVITNAGMSQGRVLLEWEVTNGVAYQVVYDEVATFGTGKGSLPVVTPASGANRVQWFDYGPPRTLAAPSNATARFYKVIALP